MRRDGDVAGAYRKDEDAEFLAPILVIVDARPTYGYRWVTALLNRCLRSERRPTVNAKRMLPITQHHGLTLESHRARRPGRTHDRVIITVCPLPEVEVDLTIS